MTLIRSVIDRGAALHQAGSALVDRVQAWHQARQLLPALDELTEQAAEQLRSEFSDMSEHEVRKQLNSMGRQGVWEYLANQSGLQVAVDGDAENDQIPFDEIEHSYFAESARGAAVRLGPNGARLREIGTVGRGLVKGSMVTAAVGGALIGLPQLTPQAYAGTVLDLDGAFVAADNGGRFGTHWTSNGCFLQDSADNVTITLYPGSLEQPVSADRFIQLDVPRGEQVCVDNVLAGFGDFSAPGAVFYDWNGIDPDQGYVFSRTSTVRPSGAPGSMGQGLPGVDFEDVASGKIQVVPTAHDAVNFRTNVGIVNGNEFALGFDVAIRGSGGAILAETVVELPAGSWHQYNDIFAKLGIPARDHAYVTVEPTNNLNAGNFLVDSSVVDNASGDPTHNQGQSRPDTNGTSFLPAAASLPGANGTEWSTQWDIMNWGGAPGNNFLGWFLLEGQNNFPGGVSSYNQEMNNGWLIQGDDVVTNNFGLEGVKGAVTYASNMQVFSRTFTTEDGQSFGAGLPGLRVDTHAIGADQYGLIPGLSQSDDRHEGFRTNLGVVNTSQYERTVMIELYDGNDLVRTLEETLEPWNMIQYNKIFGQTDITNGWARVTSDASGDRDDEGVIAYGSVVDNKSGDGSVVMAKRIGPAPPNPIDQYIEDNFPGENDRFYLHNEEIRAAIMGDRGISRSYATDIGEIFVRSPQNTGGATVDDMVAWLIEGADGVLNAVTDDFYHGFDPMQWAPSEQGGVRFYSEPTGVNVADFPLLPEDQLAFRALFKDTILPDFVSANPDFYDNLQKDPTWDTQDPNP